MRIIVGIGNPGAQYAATRHNCGWHVLDELGARHGLSLSRKKWQARCGDWAVPPSLGGGKALLLAPQTYVNRSGAAVQAAMAFHKIPPEQMLVLVDDINLALGSLRLRASGSAGGHNGLKDIEARIGKGYPRLRLGVGAPGLDQIAHVLGPFAPEEQAAWRAMVRRAADCVEVWLHEGLEAAQRFNGPPPETATDDAEA